MQADIQAYGSSLESQPSYSISSRQAYASDIDGTRLKLTEFIKV